MSYPNSRNIGKTFIFPSILIAFARTVTEQNTGLKTMDAGSTAAPLQVVMSTLYIVNVPVHYVIWFIYIKCMCTIYM